MSTVCELEAMTIEIVDLPIYPLKMVDLSIVMDIFWLDLNWLVVQ
jgi:hypothetical protein